MAAKKSTAKPKKAPAQPIAPLADNPASDPNLTAQERLDALTKQQEQSRRNPEGYPL